MIQFHRRNLNVGLDLDEVCADFLGSYKEYANLGNMEIDHFFFSYHTNNILPNIPEKFWSDIKPKIDGRKLSFLPSCYISTRSIDVRISEEWLERNGFPCMPVFHVSGKSKVDVCKDMKLDVFVDDYIRNFEEISSAGITVLLMDTCHNRQYNVDPYRIFDLNDVPEKILELGI